MRVIFKKSAAFFAILSIAVSSIACTKDNFMTNLPPADSSVPTQPGSTYPGGYLALGDSYTIGQSVPENERFPAQAAFALLKDSINLGNPKYIATTGWTTVNLQYAIAQQNPHGPYEVVTLLIGVNDQYQHLPVADYPGRFEQLLKKAISLAGNRRERVFVLSIPDYSVTPFGNGDSTIRSELDKYNFINRTITLSYNVAYIDITGISRMAAADRSLIANDGLHPSGKQYALWVKELAPAMEKALK
ncbi:MAG TPA: SGNH/GDSL hydrolase family protein [Chitinophagaceae bacterium]|nr:SGNH/GDSL hydrolase family protein [Chitinophagaceae bacterium]